MNTWEYIALIGGTLLLLSFAGGIVAIVIAFDRSRDARNKTASFPPTAIPPVLQAGACGTTASNAGSISPNSGVSVIYFTPFNAIRKACPGCGCELSVVGRKCYVCGERLQEELQK